MLLRGYWRQGGHRARDKLLLQPSQRQLLLCQGIAHVVCHCLLLVVGGSNVKRFDHQYSGLVALELLLQLLPELTELGGR